MNPKSNPFLSVLRSASTAFSVVLSIAALSPESAQAAIHTWTGGTSADWATGANWSTAVPTFADIAQWTSLSTSNLIITLASSQSVLGLKVVDPTGAVTLSGSTLTVGTSGIDMSTATQNLTISSGLTLGAGNQTWNVATGRTLSLNTGTFTRTAGATLNLQGSGTFAASMTGLTNNATGIIGPWATVGTGSSTRYATLSGSNLSSFTGTTETWTNLTVSTTNYEVTDNTAITYGGSTRTANTVRYAGTGVTITLGNGTGTNGLVTNGIINAGSGTLIFDTTSSNNAAGLKAGTSNEIVLNAANANIVVSARVHNQSNGATPAAVTIVGPNTVTLSGASDFTGGVNLNSGTLLIGNNTALGTTAGSLKLNGGTFGFSANSLNIAHGISVLAGSSITIGQNANIATTTLSGALTGSGTLVNFNSGTANTGANLFFTGNFSGFTGTMRYTGSGTNSSAFWRVGATGGTTVNLSGATLNLLAGDGGTAKLFGFIDGTTVANTLRLSQLTGDGRLQGSYNGTAGVFNTIEVGNGDASSTFSGVLGVAGSNMNQLALTKVGTGTLTLTGANIHTGLTTVSAGTLQIGNGTTDGSIANSSGINNNANLAYNLVGTHTYANAITGSGSLTKSGAGSLTLSGANNYSGTTALNGGTLKLRGSVGGVSVADGTGNTFGNATSATLSMSSLSLAGDAVLDLSLNSAPALAVSGALSTTPANGTVTINATNSAWAIGANSLISYGTFGGLLTDFTLGTVNGLSARQTSNGLVNTGNAIALDVAGDLPVWSGANGSTWATAANGDHSGPNNWATKFGQTGTNFWAGDTAEFNDTYSLGAGDVAVTNTTVSITGEVSPTAVIFNNSVVDYTINSSDSTGIAAGSVIKNGSGKVTINASNSYTGGTTINAGTISIDSAARLGASSGALTLNDGTLQTTATFDTARNITLGNANSTILTDSGTTYTVNGLISGSGALNKTGAGTLALGTSTNTFSGGFFINAGTVSVDSNVRLGGTGGTAGAITLNGGTLRTTNIAALTNTHPITIGAGGGTLDILGTGTTGQNSRVITGASTLFGSGALTINGDGAIDAAGGSGALVLTGANNGVGGYSGNITLQNGGILAYEATNGLASAATLTLANNSEFSVATGLTSSNNITVNGGTNTFLSFTNGGTGVFGGAVTLNASLTVALRNWYNTTTQNGTISGQISGNGGLTVNSGTTAGGVLTLSSANSYLGGTTISQSVVVIGDDAGLGTGAFSIAGSSGIRSNSATARSISNAFTSLSGSGVVLTLGSAGTGNLSFTDTGTTSLGSSANRTFQVDNAQTSFAGNFSGTGTQLIKTGTGILVLGGTNSSFSGGVSVNGGTVSVANIGNSAANSALGTGGTINIGATTVAGTLVYTGAGETSDKVINLAGTTGGATIEQSGTGLLAFTGNLTATGVGAKTLTLQGSTAGTGEIAGDIVNGSGTTAVTKAGTGTWTLSGANTYTGATSVNGGTLVINGANSSAGTNVTLTGTVGLTLGNTNALGSASVISLTGGTSVGTLTYATDGGGTAYQLGMSSGATYNIVLDRATAGADVTHNLDTPASAGGLGSGTVNLTSGANVSGTATASLAKFNLGGGSGGTTLIAPAAGTVVTIGSVTKSNNNVSQTLGLGGVTTGNEVTGVISNGAAIGGNNISITKSNTSTWTLSGASTYTGATTINGGTLKAGIASVANTSGAFGNNSALTTADVAGAAVDLNDFNTQVGSLAGGGAAGGNVTLGAATLTTGGNNTNTSYAGIISGTGGLIKTGTGVQTLTGINTYSGASTINTGGTLAIGSTGSIANSTVITANGTLDVSGVAGGVWTVGATQSLAGAGTITGSTTATEGVFISGTHSAGNGVGTQTVNADLTYNSGSIFSWDLSAAASDLNSVSQNGLLGSAYDGATVSGDLAGTAAVFKIVLGAGESFADDFWSGNRTWSNIFTTSNSNWAAIFTTTEYSAVGGAPDLVTQGSFTLTGSTLSWSAVPEPTTALAGMLLGAGLLRRRRPAAARP
ncbi:MAG: autotransporter-associated beta strand repeat-containing protein [Verrucomicrobiota bacterium]